MTKPLDQLPILVSDDLLGPDGQPSTNVLKMIAPDGPYEGQQVLVCHSAQYEPLVAALARDAAARKGRKV